MQVLRKPRSTLSRSPAFTTGEEATALSKVHKGKVVALAFSGDGRLLALGGDGGSITVLQWPGLRIRAALRCVMMGSRFEWVW